MDGALRCSDIAARCRYRVSRHTVSPSGQACFCQIEVTLDVP
jgi:hypothetical protein